MSVIDKVLQTQPMPARELTLAEAAAAILVAAVSADGTLAPAEGARLDGMLSSMHLYRQVPREHVQHLVDQAIALVAQRGTEAVLAASTAAIPEELRASIFALAVELVFVDGAIAKREKAFVDALQGAFGLDETLALKIVEVLLVKARA